MKSSVSRLFFSVACAGLIASCSGSVPVVVSGEAGAAADMERDAGVVPTQKAPGQEVDVDLVAAGRAFEAGDPAGARKLMKGAAVSSESGYLGALVADALGEHEKAIALLRSLSGVRDDLEDIRKRKLIEILARSGEQKAAADEALKYLESNPPINAGQRRRFMENRGVWLMDAGLARDAADVFLVARKGAAGRIRDRLDLAYAEALSAVTDDGKGRKTAVDILSRLARDAGSAVIMRKSLSALKDLDRAPRWTPKQRVEMAQRLMDLRAWDDAAATLDPLMTGRDGAFKREAKWLNARLLFKRRRHYKKAIGALDDVIVTDKVHADEARFLKARALSRLDKDEEAIRVFRVFAKKTRNVGRAAEARFLACRLEFYLGSHKAALNGLEKIVGNGKKATKTPLGPGRKRDAHFLAGLSAILAGFHRRAQAHLKAASKGSTNKEAIERNGYWYAVARLNAKRKDGADLLRGVCEADPTGWYALMASRRLEKNGKDLGPCGPVDALVDAGLDGGSIDAGKPDELPPSLQELSGLAAFFARAGLYRQASDELRATEKAGQVKAGGRDWITHYVALDAPHHAIRRAARGLRWPPATGDLWRARAAYPTPFEDLVRRQENLHDLPADLIHSIARKESLFDPAAVSGVGAMGMMQMMPHTYETNRKRAGLPPLEEGELPGPEESIAAAGYELAHLLKRFHGSMPLAIMAYNGGAAAVSRWLARSGDFPMDVFVEKAGFAQTRNYVRRVYRNMVRYRFLAGKPPPVLPQTPSRRLTDPAA